MKCPKCKKEMKEYSKGNVTWREQGYYVCVNKDCYFFGIERYIGDDKNGIHR